MKIRTIISLIILVGTFGAWAADDIRNQPGYNPATNGVWNVGTNNWGEHSYRSNAYNHNRMNWSQSSTNAASQGSNMWRHGREEMSPTNAWNHGTNAWNRSTNSWAH